MLKSSLTGNQASQSIQHTQRTKLADFGERDKLQKATLGRTFRMSIFQDEDQAAECYDDVRNDNSETIW